MRLIDADALKEWVEEYHTSNWGIPQDELIYAIGSAQTIDPVKHGKWIPVNERAAKCSLCGEWEYTNGRDKTGTAIIHRAIKHYCPNCGARME